MKNIIHIGDSCPICRHELIFEKEKFGGCTCFLGNPPCNYCTTPIARCSSCDLEIWEDILHGLNNKKYWWIDMLLK